MKWGVQQVRVTLEDSESGETVVIEQSPDGRVKCEGAKARRGERAANTPPAAAEAKTAREPEAKAERPKPARKRAAKEAGETGPRKPRASRKPEPKPEPEPAPAPTPGTALEWSPVKDHEYDGFAAPSAAGQFKVLISKNSQWALFYELKGTWPKHIACFAKLDKAKLRAQELHDAGWPESEFGPITAGQVARACPAPTRAKNKGTDKGKDEEETMKKPKAEEKPTAAPPAAPPSAEPTQAPQDKDLLTSFASDLDAVLDEDEDD